MTEKEIFEGLREAILKYDNDEAVKWARIAVEKNIDPIDAIQQGLSPGLSEIGRGFKDGTRFLPELVLSASIMKSATAILEEEIVKRGQKEESSLGKIVIGTVAGDIHDIGKSIISAILSATGFNVVDLGIDVSTERFVKAVKNEKPDILGLSALLTITVKEQEKIIQALIKNGLREGVKVIIGGGAVTREHADKIGADAYGADAVEAEEEVKKLLGII